MSDQVSTARLYLMRIAFLLNFVLLGLDVWPSIFARAGTWDPVKGVAFSFWAALSLVSGLGIRYPLRMLPLLLLQLVYKIIWMLGVCIPMWSTLRSSDLTRAMEIGIIIDLIVIPWPYVFLNYARNRGDRWK